MKKQKGSKELCKEDWVDRDFNIITSRQGKSDFIRGMEISLMSARFEEKRRSKQALQKTLDDGKLIATGKEPVMKLLNPGRVVFGTTSGLSWPNDMFLNPSYPGYNPNWMQWGTGKTGGAFVPDQSMFYDPYNYMEPEDVIRVSIKSIQINLSIIN